MPMDLDNNEEDINDQGGKGMSKVLHTFSRGSCHYTLLRCSWIHSKTFSPDEAVLSRDSIGSSCVVGDSRWAGTYGVKADFVAKSHCSVEFIPLEAINVWSFNTFCVMYLNIARGCIYSKLGSLFPVQAGIKPLKNKADKILLHTRLEPKKITII